MPSSGPSYLGSIYFKPLFRSVGFPNTCYVLLLAQRQVRLVAVSPDLPAAQVHVELCLRMLGRLRLMRHCCQRMNALATTAYLETDLEINVVFMRRLAFLLSSTNSRLSCRIGL